MHSDWSLIIILSSHWSIQKNILFSLVNSNNALFSLVYSLDTRYALIHSASAPSLFPSDIRAARSSRRKEWQVILASDWSKLIT